MGINPNAPTILTILGQFYNNWKQFRRQKRRVRVSIRCITAKRLEPEQDISWLRKSFHYMIKKVRLQWLKEASL